MSFKSFSFVFLLKVYMLLMMLLLPFYFSFFKKLNMISSSVFDGLVESTQNSVFFFLVILMISLMVFSWGLFYVQGYSSITFFLFMLIVFVLSMLLLTVSSSFMVIFIGWEGLGISSFMLIVFYQNWMSLKGGLLTLLTNRLGDGIMMGVFCYWFLKELSFKLTKSATIILILLLVVICFTKSAQFPFFSWLPAAMAAPTPVSALVHSSTLVTAGIWLLLVFVSFTFLSSLFFTFFGLITMIVASLTALSEFDAKKIVALSTLSQLGLMVTSLVVSGKMICFFHLVMHAFAKANLFLVIGTFIHNSFSQQDAHFLQEKANFLIMNFLMVISVASLSGVTFYSGFYSKEAIMMMSFSYFNSLLNLLLLMSIISLTFSYCMKLVMGLVSFNKNNHIIDNMSSFYSFSPSIVLSSLSVVTGIMMSMNFYLVFTLVVSDYGFLWVVVILSFLFTPAFLYLSKLTIWFYDKLSLIFLLSFLSIKLSKKFSFMMVSSSLESLILSGNFLSKLLDINNLLLIFGFLITCCFFF